MFELCITEMKMTVTNQVAKMTPAEFPAPQEMQMTITVGNFVTFCANDHCHYRGRVVSMDFTRPDMPTAKIAVIQQFHSCRGINDQRFGHYVDYRPRAGLYEQYLFDLTLSDDQSQ